MELPTVTPQQIVVARQIVYLFTGNLESEVNKSHYAFTVAPIFSITCFTNNLFMNKNVTHKLKIKTNVKI